jgi:small subunit ribosomal protein S6e
VLEGVFCHARSLWLEAREEYEILLFLVTPRVLQHEHQYIALKKQCTKKNKEEAAEYAKLLTKRMKEAKEKHQEQIAKRRRLSSLRASTSKSESSQK